MDAGSVAPFQEGASPVRRTCKVVGNDADAIEYVTKVFHAVKIPPG